MDTLVEDMLEVVKGLGGWDETITKFLADGISEVAGQRFSEPQAPRTKLSLSQLGSPCQRKIWYNINKPELKSELSAESLGTFFYGDLLEVLAISIVMAAGHKVEGMQDRLDVYGIKGHRDVVIDGVTVDVKSASKFSFEKFQKHQLRGYTKYDRSGNKTWVEARDVDAFGYISQLGSYVSGGKDDPIVTEKNKGAFLVIQKDRFKICLDTYDFTDEIKYKEQEVQQVVRMVEGPIPMRGEDEVEDGKSGNMKLGVACSYCDFRSSCWPDVRTFIYSTGPRFLTKVVRQPAEHIKEITQ
ncbi:MAG: hypothetical protein COA78_20460 [Blastopirellula sp.]|nr:MAG: hypothetical protein COA78_20460 [Blastopirellula sp.]